MDFRIRQTLTATPAEPGELPYWFRPGTRVVAGQTLLVVSGDRGSAALGSTDTAIGTAIKRQLAQIHATLLTLPRQSAVQRRALRNRMATFEVQVQQIDKQLVLQRSEAKIAAALVKKVRPLETHGYVSAIQFDQFRDAAITAHAEINNLESNRASIQEQRSALKEQLLALPLNTAVSMHKLAGKLAQLAISAAQNDVSRAATFSAQQAGVVTSVLVKPGQAVQSGVPLLSVLPENSPLEARLLVPSSAVGFLHPGIRVLLNYQAFPYQKSGVQHGTIFAISRNALTPQEVTELYGRPAPATPLYQVDVKLAQQVVFANGQAHALLPGMAFNADLMLGRHRLIDWIFEPLHARRKSSETSAL